MWQRFTVADPKQQLWYYTSVAEILQRRLPGPLTDELGEHRRDDRRTRLLTGQIESRIR